VNPGNFKVTLTPNWQSSTLRPSSRREGRWVLADLEGKGRRIRTVAIPIWVKLGINAWMTAAGIEDGRLLRSVSKSGKISRDTLSDWAVWSIVEQVCTSEARKIRVPLVARQGPSPSGGLVSLLCAERRRAFGVGVAGGKGPLRRVNQKNQLRLSTTAMSWTIPCGCASRSIQPIESRKKLASGQRLCREFVQCIPQRRARRRLQCDRGCTQSPWLVP
jgi:hypothetical protein